MDDLATSEAEQAAWQVRNEHLCRLAVLLARQDVAPDDVDWTTYSMQEQRDVLTLVVHELRRQKRLRRSVQRRAQDLLRTFLTADQRADLRRRREFFVTGSAGGIYRLMPSRGHVERVEQHGRRWFAKVRYCLHDPESVLPPADVTIGHLLWLSCDEPAFLTTANATVSNQLWNCDYLRMIREGRRKRAANSDRQPAISDQPSDSSP